MIILLLINILELLAIVYLLWTLFEQITKYENMKDSRDNAVSWLEKAEKERDYWKNQCLCLDDEYVTVQTTQEQFEEYHQYKQTFDEIEKQVKAISNRTPLFEIEQIAKDLIKIKNTINKVKEK